MAAKGLSHCKEPIHSVWVSVYSIQAQLPALEAKPETNKYRLPRCAHGLRRPPWYTGRSLGCPPSSHSLQAWHHRGTHRDKDRDRSCALPAPAPSLSVQGPALPLAGRWEGRMGARVQVPGCRLGSLFKDRGAGRQAPEPAGFYAPLYAFTVLQWPGPTPTAVLPLPCPPGPLEGALRSHTSFRPCL